MKKIDGCGMEKFGTLHSIEKTVAILGNRWWPHSAKEEGDIFCFHAIFGRNVLIAKMLAASLLVVGTVRRLESDAWLMAK